MEITKDLIQGLVGVKELISLTYTGYVGFSDFNPEDFKVDELNRTYQIVSKWGKIKSINRYRSSYNLKHIVENYIKVKVDNNYGYVSNGTLILAMYLAGFHISHKDVDSKNAYFNVSEKSIKETKI